jgi:hypothetical protein
MRENKEKSITRKIIESLFFRKEKGEGNRDDLSGYPNWRIGISLAASWSWGISVVLGVSIMHTKGVIPCFAWMVGNILALPLFGVLHRNLSFFKQWSNLLPVILFFFFIEFFAIILNLQGMLTGLGGGVDLISYKFLPRTTAVLIVMAIGLFIVWYINRGGLKLSFLTDFWQFGGQLAGVVALAAISFFFGDINPNIQLFKSGGMEWAKTGFLGVLFGALVIGHQWQRFTAIKQENVLKASLWSSLFFGIYMIFVAITALFFAEDPILGGLLMIMILTMSSSTIDSSVASLEYIMRKFKIKPYWGTLFALVTIISWPLLMNVGITKLYTWMVAIRIHLVAALLVLSLIMIFKPIQNRLYPALIKMKLLKV